MRSQPLPFITQVQGSSEAAGDSLPHTPPESLPTFAVEPIHPGLYDLFTQPSPKDTKAVLPSTLSEHTTGLVAEPFQSQALQNMHISAPKSVTTSASHIRDAVTPPKEFTSLFSPEEPQVIRTRGSPMYRQMLPYPGKIRCASSICVPSPRRCSSNPYA